MTTEPTHEDNELLPGHCLGTPDYFEAEGNDPAGWYAPILSLGGDIEGYQAVETEVCVDGCGKDVPAEFIDKRYISVRCRPCRKLADDAQETYGRLLATMAAAS